MASRPWSLRGLHKSFGAQVVLNGIDLTVARGETLAVLGRSGTGKSVLLKIIIGLEKPDAGSVNIHGQEIAGINPRSSSTKSGGRWGFCSSRRRSTTR